MEDLLKVEFFIIPEDNNVAYNKNKRRIPVPKGMDIELGNLNRCYPGNPDGLPMEKAAYEIKEMKDEVRDGAQDIKKVFKDTKEEKGGKSKK